MFTRVPRPAILDRIDPTQHVVIEASAGTGKTYTLEHLVAELVVVHSVPIEQILVVTFTDKATREMRERVRATLRRVHAAEQLASESEPAWHLDEDARQRVADAIAAFDRAPISTIHAFCQRVLTENAFDCSRLLRQEQVESRAAFGIAFREELRARLVDDEPLRPVLELALSTYSVDRIQESLYRWYIERGQAEPAFDRELARSALRAMPGVAELRAGGAVARALADGLKRNPKKQVPRLLELLAPAVERAREEAGLFDALMLYWAWSEQPAPSSMTALRYVRKYLGGTRAARLRPLADRVEALASAGGTMFGVLVSELLPHVVRRLAGTKSERGHFDFDDMLSMLRDALCSPRGAPLIRELRRRYRVALVDEFQDTDRVQWDIFRTLFVDHDGPWRLVVIGDPKQAIYGFRNADVYTYHHASARLCRQGGQRVSLTTSYRSTAPFLDALDLILRDGFFSGVNRYPDAIQCGRPHLRLLDSGGACAAPVTLVHLVGRPSLRAGWIARAHAEYVATKIAQILDGGLMVDRGAGPRRIAPSDVHVLCRSRADALAVGVALTAASIPHAFYKQEGLFSTEAARHVWELLRAIEEPGDRVRRLHAWLTPFFAVPLELVERCRDLPADHALIGQLRRWRTLADGHRFAALFTDLLDGTGLVRRELFLGGAERDLTDYQHVLEIMLQESHLGAQTLPQLVERLGAFITGRALPAGESGDVQRLESERAAVQIMTMHKSKGLEAEVVFLVGGLTEPPSDRLCPRVVHDDAGTRLAWLGDPPAHVRERMARERREEAERLLYVAMTRARSKLYLPYFGPPPSDAEPEVGASYALEAAEPAPEPPPAQLGLLFDDPELSDGREVQAPDTVYRLRRMTGPYRVLNDRLTALVGAGHVASKNTRPALFDREVVAVTPPPRGQRLSTELGQWRPSVPEPSAVDPRFLRAKARRGGFDITSYTRMKRDAPSPRLDEGAAFDEGLNSLAGAGEPDVAERGAPSALPGGSAVGVFLHEVLEHIPFERLSPDADLLAEPELSKLFVRRARANGIREAHLPEAARLIARAMCAPVDLADGSSLKGGLASLDRRAAELPFLIPIPESTHPPLGATPSGPDDPPLRIERGFIRGVIDLVAEHAGRFHVVDYKSDRLPGYDRRAVTRHVDTHYMMQAKLYTIGALRALRIHDALDYEARFGGLLYAFLRGMAEPGQGVFVLRPTWEDVTEWEGALLDDQPWGYPLPPRRSRA